MRDPDPVYILIKTEFNSDGSVDSRTIHEFRTVALDELVNNLEYFIRGCSFYPPEGAQLDFCEGL